MTKMCSQQACMAAGQIQIRLCLFFLDFSRLDERISPRGYYLIDKLFE